MSISKDFLRFLDRHRRMINDFLTSYESDVQGILKGNNKKARSLYTSVIRKMKVDGDTQRIRPILENFNKLEALRRGIGDLTVTLRKQVIDLSSGSREDLLEMVFEKEQSIEELLKIRGGVKDKRSKITKEEAKMLDNLFRASLVRINTSLEKWKNFSYTNFFQGVSQALTPIDLEATMFTETGNIKIGSSLEFEVDAEASRAIMEQRTQYQMNRAQRLGYTRCWNHNPLDEKTKPVCMSATLAGVIPLDQMISDYGTPPRPPRCRCDLTFVDESWADFANGINLVIDERRKDAVVLLEAMPLQKTRWFTRSYDREQDGVVIHVRRHWNNTSDTERISGKRYKSVEDRIKILKENPVPKYEWTPPDGWRPPRDFRTLAQLISPEVIALGEENIARLTDDELRAFVAGDLRRNEIEDIIAERAFF